MSHTEERARKSAVASMEGWIEKNKDVCGVALELAKFVVKENISSETREQVLQIAALNEEHSDYLASVYIDHPVYGTIMAHINSPKSIVFQFFDDWFYPFENEVEGIEEAKNFVMGLKKRQYAHLEMVEFAAENRDILLVNSILAEMLYDYHIQVDAELDALRNYMEQNKKFIALRNEKAVWAGEEYVPISRIAGRIDLSFLAQPCPFVFLQTDENEKVVSAVNEESTQILKEKMARFFKLEGTSAALLHAAQKSVAQRNYKVEVVTDGKENEADHTAYLIYDEIAKEPIPMYVLHATRLIAHSPLEKDSTKAGVKSAFVH